MARYLRRALRGALIPTTVAATLAGLFAGSSDAPRLDTLQQQPAAAPAAATADRLVSSAGPGVARQGPAAPAEQPPASASGAPVAPVYEFAWPAEGSISQGMTATHPTGIDVAATAGEPIHAVRAGRVTFAGGDACCEYGYHVIVEHDGGWSSLYAHLSVVSVKAGERVEQGRLLGLAGDSGKADGVHLHFELWSYGGRVNPLSYLEPYRYYIRPSDPVAAPAEEPAPTEEAAPASEAQVIAAAVGWMEGAGYAVDRGSCFAIPSGPNWAVSCAAEPPDCAGVAVCETLIEACVVGSELLVEATCSGY